jgi:hypothetical protein
VEVASYAATTDWQQEQALLAFEHPPLHAESPGITKGVAFLA